MYKSIFIFLATMLIASCNAQRPMNSYFDKWLEVEQLEQKNKTKSAKEIVNDIAALAKVENNAPQELKCLLHLAKYMQILEEDAKLKIVNQFKERIADAKEPTKSLLQNTLANMYWQYLQNNGYKIYNRTASVEEQDTSDFRTWDYSSITNEIHRLFTTSLENKKLLSKVDLSTYHQILTLAADSKKYRPHLYDLLAHNALSFYTREDYYSTKATDEYIITDRSLLMDVETFKEVNISKPLTYSSKYHALKIYQELTKKHLDSGTEKSIIDLDIQRLKYVYQQIKTVEKENLYLQTLQKSVATYDGPANSNYTFQIAQIYYVQGSKYSPENPIFQFKKKEALDLCRMSLERPLDKHSKQSFKNLEAQITHQNLRITLETYSPIKTNSRALITYSNYKNIALSIYKISYEQELLYKRTGESEKQIDFVNKLDHKVYSQTEVLKSENDYQSHQQEVLIPKLDNGVYLIAFGNETGQMEASETFHITNIALTRKKGNENYVYSLINRLSGAPIPNAKVTISYAEGYNRNEQPKTTSATTDNKGNFVFNGSKTMRNVDFYVKAQSDQTHFYENYIYENKNRQQRIYLSKQAFLFTDRAIYRPGQKVYFKGIAIEKRKNNSKVLTNETGEIILKDVNREEIARLEVQSNEFGSFSGEFILPVGRLTGQFSIYFDGEQNDLNAHKYFSVEEYKRPKFETKFDKVTDSYKINDSIKVKGHAMAYAGSNISDAKVVYKVTRKARYPYWCWWRRYQPSNSQEITFGETTTDENGKFDITFKAIPDLSLDKADLPTFSYEVSADVIDINGETRSATSYVNVGYHAVTASISTPSSINKSAKNQTINVSTSNLNGQPIATNGELKINKLIAPVRVLRQRPWNAPDYQKWNKTSFSNLFPYDAYKDESDYRTWDNGKTYFSKSITSNEYLSISNFKKWPSGKYLIEYISKDKFGQEVKAISYFTIEDEEELADNQLFELSTDKDSYFLGDEVKLSMSTNAEKLTVYFSIEKGGKLVSEETIELKNGSHKIKIPVSDNDLGGFAINYSFAYKNSFINGSKVIAVPYPSKFLTIETMTFRDKLNPAQEETWKFKIKGPKGDQVSAELLASMYDLSLDQFKPHNWDFNPLYRPHYYSTFGVIQLGSFGTKSCDIFGKRQGYYGTSTQSYDQLNWFGFNLGRQQYQLLNEKSVARGSSSTIRSGNAAPESAAVTDADSDISSSLDALEAPVLSNVAVKENRIDLTEEVKQETQNSDNIVARKNFEETAFFFPQLSTDKEGNVAFEFTTPESLTKWKLQLLAHTKNLNYGQRNLETVTQKELMITPNFPRFLREGDNITISCKISNLTEAVLNGKVRLELYDALTNNKLTELVKSASEPSFVVNPKGNTSVDWKLTIPVGTQSVKYRIVAQAGNFSDGEENVLPVLSNRILVTETLPIWIKSGETKTFTLDKLKEHKSTTLTNHKLSLEMTSNPAWYAVQALPYLIEYPHECAEQTFARYYANALANHIITSKPQIKAVFDQWASSDALISNLEKNQELKSLLIQETPWLRDAQSETEQKKRIALLFDVNKMSYELKQNLNKLQRMQQNGNWSWFRGGQPNRFITQHIISGLGHLDKLGVEQDSKANQITSSAIRYLDNEFKKDYDYMVDNNYDLKKNQLSAIQLHYLYLRSFYSERQPNQKIIDYYLTQIETYWTSLSLYQQGMAALVLHRNDRNSTANLIIESLKENSIVSEELGMYWKANSNSWNWYQSSIETQSLLIEAFAEIENDTETIDQLKIWLLKNKQTNRWETTKSTTEAVYALLLQGSDWIGTKNTVDVQIGDLKIDPSNNPEIKTEAGTGYYKVSWDKEEIKPNMSTVKVSQSGKGIAWGGLYWQYFEDMDKITYAKTPLSIEKKLYKKSNTSTGEELSEINEQSNVAIGDLVRVRIIIKTDRDMEFIHLKDMRASAFEPVNVISNYKWQDGLGYYQSTKDASTNFFFDYMRKGVYVFEYDLRVNNKGDFSNGISTIQSMYAPEFSSHSDGIRVKIK